MLSGAVSQIRSWTGLGVVAISIDELLSATPRKFRTAADAQAFLRVQTQNYLHRNQRYFNQYFSADRLTAALVSAAQVITVIEGNIPPSVHSEWTVWTHPDLSPDNERRFAQLRNLLSLRG